MLSPTSTPELIQHVPSSDAPDNRSYAALKKLIQQGWVHPEERIVLFNTGSGLKYLDHKS